MSSLQETDPDATFGSAHTTPPAQPRRRRAFRLTSLAAVVATGAVATWLFLPDKLAVLTQASDARAAQAAPSSSAAQRKGAERPVPVFTAKAGTADVRVVQNGLGSVVPERSVTVRSRVTGQLQRVLFQEGDLVEAGQLLAELDPRTFQAELVQVEGQAARDRALLDNARVDHQRYQSLRDAQIAKQEDVDARASAVRQHEGSVHADQGLLAQARLQLSFTSIVAPISGRIGLRRLDAGNNVSPSDAEGLALIHSVQPINVVFSLPEDQVTPIAKRLNAARAEKRSLVVEAWDKGNRNRLAAGTLLTLDNQIDPATGTFKLKAQFPNEEGALFPNQFVNVRLFVETRARATVVPSTAVQHGSNGTFVYVVKPDSSVALKQVSFGPADGELVSVEKGLLPGEVVVVNGADRLREGAKVTIASERRKP